jgi:uncharacterized membrane protein
MSEALGKNLQRMKEKAEAKSIVTQAALHSLKKISDAHKLGEGVVRNAGEAVKQDLGEYLSTGTKENISDLRNIAQDAAEGILRDLGFDSPEILSEFNKDLDEQLNLPDENV